MLSDAANFTKPNHKTKLDKATNKSSQSTTPLNLASDSTSSTSSTSSNLAAGLKLPPRILKRYGSRTELIDRFADVLQAQERAAYQAGSKGFNILVSGGAGGEHSVAMRLLAATLLRYHHHHRRALGAEPAYFEHLAGWNIFFADERCVAQFDNESFFEMFYDWAHETVIQYPQHPEVYDIYYYARPPGPPKADLAPEYLQGSRPPVYDESVLDMLKRYEATIDRVVPKALHPRTHQQLPRFDLVLLDLGADGSVAGLDAAAATAVEEAKLDGYLHLVTSASPAYLSVTPQVLETASNVFVFVDPAAAAAAAAEEEKSNKEKKAKKLDDNASLDAQQQRMADTFERVLKPSGADFALPAVQLYQARQGDVEFYVDLGIHKRL